MHSSMTHKTWPKISLWGGLVHNSQRAILPYGVLYCKVAKLSNEPKLIAGMEGPVSEGCLI